MDENAAVIISELGLVPHPEGGHYAEVYRHASAAGGRGAATSIYYINGINYRPVWAQSLNPMDMIVSG